jgi:nicotinate-nucleotide adenylyltransferase
VNALTSSLHKKIGVFGGAFDPPHWAHRSIAEAALQQLDLDMLYVLPTGHAWHKSRALTPAAHRVAMCEEAFAGLQPLCIDQREIRRSGPTYTADTLAEISAEHPGASLYLLLGADQLLAFKTWIRWEEVMGRATLVVANRALHIGADADPHQQEAQSLSGVGLPFVPLEMPLHNISATAVRAHIHGASRRFPDLDVLVPEGVARYISEHHLYQSTT